MSLVTSASPWTNDDSINKKRPSTMKKQMKLLQSVSGPDEYVSQAEGYQNLQPSSLDDNQGQIQDRTIKINDLLNKVTSADISNDSSKLGNFNPPSAPAINVKKDYVMINQSSNGQDQSYGVDNTKTPVYSNYMKSYEPSTIPFPVQENRLGPTTGSAPYYARMGINGMGDSKLLEKINYMIHLLEEQQSEKTSNITEEFILYTFLGVFIIFIVDSFARAGKYTR